MHSYILMKNGQQFKIIRLDRQFISYIKLLIVKKNNVWLFRI